MEINWTVLGVVAFCVIIFIVYLIIKNLKDQKEAMKFFSDQIKDEKKFELDDESEL
jgi:hypothetical protein